VAPGVVPDPGDEGCRSAQVGYRDGLVEALASGQSPQRCREDGLSRGGESRYVDDQIDVGRADHGDVDRCAGHVSDSTVRVALVTGGQGRGAARRVGAAPWCQRCRQAVTSPGRMQTTGLSASMISTATCPTTVNGRAGWSALFPGPAAVAVDNATSTRAQAAAARSLGQRPAAAWMAAAVRTERRTKPRRSREQGRDWHVGQCPPGCAGHAHIRAPGPEPCRRRVASGRRRRHASHLDQAGSVLVHRATRKLSRVERVADDRVRPSGPAYPRSHRSPSGPGCPRVRAGLAATGASVCRLRG
jgi:hypothetical protein